MTETLQTFAQQLHKWGANVTAIEKGTKRPAHKWQQWQKERQTEDDVNNLPWSKAAAVGVVNGSGDFRVFDIDAPKNQQGNPLYQVPEQVLVTALKAIGLPDDYQWSYASGSGAGWGFVIRCQEAWADLESGVLRGEPKAGLQFDHLELRWSSGQTVIDGRHPSGPGYRWRLGERPFMPPALVTVERVLNAFQAIAVPGYDKGKNKDEGTTVSPGHISAYGRGALNDAIGRVSTSPNGSRNNTLFEQTAGLVELVNGGVLLRQDVEQGMMGAALAAGLPEGEIQATLASAFKRVGNAARVAGNGQVVVVEGGVETAVSGAILPLPESATIDPAWGVGACQWLDEYVAFSRRMSPRGYDGFHEAVGLWVLSTVAARRLRVGMGTKGFCTNLNIALCAFTTLYAKTTTAQVGLLTLEKAGLAYLLAPNDATPQAFINLMAGHIPADYGKLSLEGQEREKQQLIFPAQRGWFYEEFGTKIQAMMKDGGFMADFRGILRTLDDNPPRYEYKTMTRRDVVERPYLALLANMTPADLKPYARPGAALWHDGFWARWILVTPPIDEPLQFGRFPDGEMDVPTTLIEPLKEWHRRLGVPHVTIEEELNDKGESTGRYSLNREEIQPTSCHLGDGVLDAFYVYHDGLVEIAQEQVENGNADLVGNYGRFAEKAMRAAILLGSLSNGNHIEMAHWARGQGMAERWRMNLHNLAAQVSLPVVSEDSKRQEQVVSVLQRHGPGTAAEIGRYVRGMSGPEVEAFCQQLVKADVLTVVEKTQRGTNRYDLLGNG